MQPQPMVVQPFLQPAGVAQVQAPVPLPSSPPLVQVALPSPQPAMVQALPVATPQVMPPAPAVATVVGPPSMAFPYGKTRTQVMGDRFKTKMCEKWVESGACRYGTRCMFAHGEKDLRSSEMNVRDGLLDEESVWRYKKQREAELLKKLQDASPDTPEAELASVVAMLPPQHFESLKAGANYPNTSGVVEKEEVVSKAGLGSTTVHSTPPPSPPATADTPLPPAGASGVAYAAPQPHLQPQVMPMTAPSLPPTAPAIGHMQPQPQPQPQYMMVPVVVQPPPAPAAIFTPALGSFTAAQPQPQPQQIQTAGVAASFQPHPGP